ncbi:replication/maintenance protein RepL, partial [Priestia aryabhattai]
MDEKEKKKKIMTTRKKIKFSGTQKYINQDTGEIVEMNVTEIEERDANFHKVWL